MPVPANDRNSPRGTTTVRNALRLFAVGALASICMDAVADNKVVGVEAPVCALSPLATPEAVDMRQLRGQVVYVDFWASWCGPCAQAFPFMNALDREFRERGLQIIGINVDEHPADARRFLAKHAASFRLAADPGGDCPRRFGVRAMPSSYLIDRNGVVRYEQVGFRAGATGKLRQVVEQLLAEPFQ
jgi:thiol-disulfide isomerase/thioredoxin